MRPGNVLLAGTIYFLIVFAVGFPLGALRVLMLTPALGAVGAVLAELPIMIAVSALTAWQICIRMPILGSIDAAKTGALAFVLLQASEVALAVGVFQISPGDYIEALGSLSGLLGMAGQLIFALLPLVFARPRI